MKLAANNTYHHPIMPSDHHLDNLTRRNSLRTAIEHGLPTISVTGDSEKLDF